MMSRREKLLVQPWEERRYKDHRDKVASARAAVDASAPARRAHVAARARRRQRSAERRAGVAADNFSLLQRLARVMQRNRLDNRWEKPLPNFQNKVGKFHDAETLQRRMEKLHVREPWQN